jgi:CRP-like cAMP-binding protein
MTTDEEGGTPKSGRGSRPPETNLVLSGLHGHEGQQLFSKGTRVRFRAGTIVYELGDRISEVYFLRSGLASLLAGDEDGNLIEVAMAGCEAVLGGMVALSFEVSPYRVIIQSDGEALRFARGDLVHLFHDSIAVRQGLGRYLGFLSFQFSLSAMCIGAHSLDRRVARWLMICHEHLGTPCHVTQESLAETHGVTRTAITLALAKLAGENIIRQGRGRIEILQPEELEQCCCVCYRAYRSEYRRTFPSTIRFSL